MAIKEHEYYRLMCDRETGKVNYRKTLGRKTTIGGFVFYLTNVNGWWVATEEATGAKILIERTLKDIMWKFKNEPIVRELKEKYDTEPIKGWRENMQKFLEGEGKSNV